MSWDLEKMRRYGWNENTGEKGRFKNISKTDIMIDEKYQRSQRQCRIIKIASKFSWKLFGVVLVAQRANGKYYAIDGGHRVQAAMLRPDIDSIPCFVFSDTNTASEATQFIGINADRATLTGANLYKAKIAAKDPIALKLRDSLAAHGISDGIVSSRNKNTIRCPLVCLPFARNGSIDAVLDFLNEAWPDDPIRLRASFINAVSAVLIKSSAIGIDTEELRDALSRTNALRYIHQAAGNQSATGESAMLSIQKSMAAEWNRNKSRRRLSIVKDDPAGTNGTLSS